MKKIICLLMLSAVLFACSDSDEGDGLTDAERKAKTEQLYLLQNELVGIKTEIARVQAQLSSAQGGVAIALREQLQDKTHRKSEIERQIQGLKKELGIT